MQLHIFHKLDEPLILPINYNHIIQAIIYSWLGSTEYSAYIHDQGFSFEKRKFKMFTFGRLKGRSSVRDKKITFYEDVSFEVRSPDAFMMQKIQEGVMKNGISYGGRLIKEVETKCTDNTVEARAILVQMDSPITVYKTDPNTKKTYYCSPDDAYFSSMVQNNFYRKYYACTGVEVEREFRIIPFDVRESDKVVTSYKGNYITAYRGKYILVGERKHLDFLYQAGIGSKNSQGFGMFNILEEDDEM